MKLLIMAIDGMGMGHLNRTLVLARALKDIDPDADIRFLVESQAFSVVSRSDFPVLKLPDPRHSLGCHALRGGRHNLESDMVKCVALEFRPQAVLFDFLLNRKLFRFLRRRNCRNVVLLRKMRPRAMRQIGSDPAAPFVDSWLVPHLEEDFQKDEIPAALRPRCHFSGPITRKLNISRVPELRSRYAAGMRHLVVVTLGGGGSPEARRLLSEVIVVIRRLKARRQDLKVAVVCGPLYPDPLPPAEDGVEVIRFEPDMPELLASADLVVCNAGYNTVKELISSGTPGILLPLKSTGRDDQLGRAEEAIRSGRVVMASSRDEIEKGINFILDGKGPLKKQPELEDNDYLGRALAFLIEG